MTLYNHSQAGVSIKKRQNEIRNMKKPFQRLLFSIQDWKLLEE